MDHEPTVWPIEWGELLEFCNSAGYRCRLEPSGSLLIPPDYNVGMTDWEKSLRLRKGEFSVLGNEPAPRQAGEGFFLDGPNWVFESAPIMQGEACGSCWWSCRQAAGGASCLVEGRVAWVSGGEGRRPRLAQPLLLFACPRADAPRPLTLLLQMTRRCTRST